MFRQMQNVRRPYVIWTALLTVGYLASLISNVPVTLTTPFAGDARSADISLFEYLEWSQPNQSLMATLNTTAFVVENILRILFFMVLWCIGSYVLLGQVGHHRTKNGRCPWCGYILPEHAVDVCSECGVDPAFT
ncbi:MAG: hypothetical protein KC983_10345 [Phycisphaerales bacterium]|nr:hypothetical protein [Phycisphaerales bacterium]